MKVLVVGGSGLIGTGVVKWLKHFEHEVIIASKNEGDVTVDLTNHDSIVKMYENVPDLNAVIATPGSIAKDARPEQISREEFERGFSLKAFGQIDLVLTGIKYLKQGGSFTLTTGIMSTHYPPLVCCTSAINNCVEGFVKCAAHELPNNLRLNVVSPGLIEEARGKIGAKFKGFRGVSLEEASLEYMRSVEGVVNGQVLKVWP